MRTVNHLLLLMGFSPLLSIHLQVFSQTQIPFAVISNGGEKQSNITYTIIGSLGQTSIGKYESTKNKVSAGF